MKNALISAAVALAVVAGYDFAFGEKSPAQQVAVVNFDSAILSLGPNPSNDMVNTVTEDLQKKASLLSAAGFIVVDSRVLVSYPADAEVPYSSPSTPEAAAVVAPSASNVDPGAFDE